MLSAKSIHITPEILNIIASIDEFKGTWNALEQHTTSLNLMGDVAHFGKNFKSIMAPWKSQAITVEMIQKLHQVIMRDKKAGGFKTSHMPIIVQHDDRIYGSLDTATPEDTNALMQNLTDWLAHSIKKKSLHPILVIAIFTAVFLQIGPFDKGNQKVIRLLIPLLMLKAGYGYAPYVSLEDILLKHSEDYFKNLKIVQDSLEEGKPNWQPWIEFFIFCLQEHKNILQKQMKASEKNLGKLPILSIKIMELFRKHERLQMKEIEKMTDAKRSTLKLRLNELVEDGYLNRHGQARSTWYARA